MKATAWFHSSGSIVLYPPEEATPRGPASRQVTKWSAYAREAGIRILAMADTKELLRLDLSPAEALDLAAQLTRAARPVTSH